jgi:four helix bundle protein
MSADLRERTKAFAVRVVKLFAALPKNDLVAQTLGKQLLRSGTSVGAQYREGLRARSRAEFASKIQASLQELEESQYWFELLVETELLPESRLRPLMEETNELMAMLASSVRTAKRNNDNHRE